MKLKMAILTILLVGLVGCGPAPVPPVDTIETNETAFLVPLEGNTKKDQAAFMSVDFLEEAKVAAKRVTLPIRKRDTGRMWWSYEWLPTMKLIKVSRAPVTREWTQTESTGTTNRNQALAVESLDSISFAVGVNITAMIEERDAALFLNKFAGKPLSHIVDTNIRGYVLTIAADEFGSRTLKECKEDKKQIFDKIREKTKAYFQEYGITITNLGHSEGLTYLNPAIQKAIDDAYVAEMDKEKAFQEKEAQAIRNTTAESIAASKRKQAQEFAKAAKAQQEMISLEIQKMKAQAMLNLSTKWDGKYPSNMMPQGADLLMNVTK